MFLVEGIKSFTSLRSNLAMFKSCVALVHIIHIVIAGVMTNLQFWVHHKHLLQSVLHTKNATDNNSTLCINICLTLENLREILKHALCYSLVLLSTQES